MVHQHKQQSIEVCLGYYDGIEHGKIVSPYHTGDDFPELTEMHEAIHAELALANTTDVLTRHFAAVLRLGKNELPPAIVTEIERLMDAMHQHSAFVHEAIATYLSCHVYHSFAPGLIKRVISELPPRYASALQAAILAFGSLEEAADTPFSEYVAPLVFGVGIAAMNISYDDLQLDIACLSPYVTRIRSDPPNKRFAAFLGKLEPPSRDGVLRDLITQAVAHQLDKRSKETAYRPDQPYSEIQMQLFARLRRLCPHIQFTSCRNDARLWSQAIYYTIRQQVEGLGMNFMERYVLFTPTAQDHSVEAKMGTTFINPELPDETFPLDVSLTRYNHPFQEAEHLQEVASAARTTDLLLHLFILPLSEDEVPKTFRSGKGTIFAVSCLAEDRKTGPISEQESKANARFRPFFTLISVEDFDSLVPVLRECDAVIKADERAIEPLLPRLQRWRLPSFVLLRDTAITHIIAIASKMAQDHTMVFAGFNIGGKANALVFWEKDSYIYYCTPITLNAWALLKNKFESDEHVVFPTEKEVRGDGSIDVPLVSRVLRLCFGAG